MDRFLRISGYFGPVLLVASALLFIITKSHPLWVCVLFSIGVVLLTLNRFMGPESDFQQSKDTRKQLAIRRLYRQRCVGTLVLYLSVLLLFLHEGFYYGYYLRKSSWLLPFIVFTVIELYTAFRLPSLEEKSRKNRNNV